MAQLQFGNQSKSYLDLLVRYGLNSPKSFAFEQITVDSTVQSLTIPDGAKYAICVLESDASSGSVARMLQNKSTPVSSSVGIPVNNGSIFEISDYANLNGFQITEIASHTTILNVEYFK